MEEKETKTHGSEEYTKSRKERIMRYLNEEIAKDGRRKKEILRQVLEELLPEVKKLLSQGTSKAKLYRAINRYLEEEGMEKVSYKHFLTVLNDLLKKNSKQTPTSSTRPDKLDPLNLL